MMSICLFLIFGEERFGVDTTGRQCVLMMDVNMSRNTLLTVVTELGDEKWCRSCGEYWPADAEFFQPQMSSHDGWSQRCIACIRDRVWRNHRPCRHTDVRAHEAEIEQVNQATVQIEHATQQNVALVERATKATASMRGQADRLAQAVRVFKI